MSEFWQPYYKITMIHDDGGELILESSTGAVLEHGIKIKGDVQATYDSRPNEANLSILGLDPETQDLWAVSRGFNGYHNIEIELGYEEYGFSGVIFTGAIYEAKRNQQGTENWFNMKLGQKIGGNSKVINEQYTKGDNQSLLFSLFDSFAGSGSDSLKSEVEKKTPESKRSLLKELFSFGKNVTGNPVEKASNELKKLGLTLVHDQDGYHIFNANTKEQVDVHSIGPDSGLIGTPNIEPTKVDFSCQLNPELKMGQKIFLHSETFAGLVEIRPLKTIFEWPNGVWDNQITAGRI